MYDIPTRSGASRRFRVIKRSPKVETVIVVIPGVGTLQPEEWRDDTGAKWLEAIEDSLKGHGYEEPGLAVFCFTHGIRASDTDLWETLISCGASFRKDLFPFLRENKLTHCPVVMVAHSLGGVIAKEALQLVYKQGSNYRPFLRSLAGLILLGTPHTTIPKEWSGFVNILYTGSEGQKPSTVTSKEAAMLCESSRNFENAGILQRLVSMYETQQTKVRKSMFNQHKSMLVDSSAVVTGARNEILVPLDADHRTLCNIDIRDQAYRDLCTILSQELKESRLKIAAGSPEYRAPTVLDTQTIIDPSDLPPLSLEESNVKSQSGQDSNSDPLSTWVGFNSTQPSDEPSGPPKPMDNEETPKGPQLPCFMVPVSKNKEFFGRRLYIEQIERAFFAASPFSPESIVSETDSPQTFAIYGPGGMGKTQLATQFVYESKDRFDAVFWVHADKAAKIAEDFGKIASQLNLVNDDSPDARDPVVIRELVKGWLVNPVRKFTPSDEEQQSLASWLIVFDNVDEHDELEDYWPLDGPGCVLFTSRDPYVKDSHYLAQRGTELKPFDVDEASQFLKKLTRKKDDGAPVAQLLGGLPLAMTQIAAVIARRGLSFSEFVTAYKEEEGHRAMFEDENYLKKARKAQGYEHTLASVWALEGLKHGRVILDTLAFLDPDGVHERILITHPHVVERQDFPRTATTYQKARQELTQSSLVTKDTAGERLIVHRLIQDAARSKMTTEHYRTMHATALSLVSSIWPFESFGWRHGVARWRVCEELAPHLLRLKELAAFVQPEIGTSWSDFKFIKLLNDAGWYYHESGNFGNAEDFFNTAQKGAEIIKTTCKDLTPEQSRQLELLLGEIHHNLGCVGTETNEPIKTLEHFQQFKRIVLEKATGDGKDSKKDSMSVSIAWNELGNAWMLNKEWAQGEDCFKKSIEAARNAGSTDPTDVSFPNVNLGLAYWLTDRYEEAYNIIEVAIKARADKFGIDDRESFITGRLLHAQGNVLKSLGRLDESLKFHERGLEQYLHTIGQNHHRTGDMHVKVAEHYIRLGRFDEASQQLEHAERIFAPRKTLRPEHCRVLFKKRLLLEAKGDADKAKDASTECQKVFRELQGTNFGADVANALDEKVVDGLVAFWSQ